MLIRTSCTVGGEIQFVLGPPFGHLNEDNVHHSPDDHQGQQHTADGAAYKINKAMMSESCVVAAHDNVLRKR